MLEEALNSETHMAAICFAYVCLCAVMHGIDLTPDKMTDRPNSMQTSQIPMVKWEVMVHVIRIMYPRTAKLANDECSFTPQ